MKEINQRNGIVLGLILLGFICYGLFWLGIKISVVLSALKPDTLAAIFGTMTTVAGGIAAVIITNRQSKQRDIDESHRAKKVEIYKEYLDVVSGLMAKTNECVSKKGMSDQQLIDYLVEFQTDLMLWGSPSNSRSKHTHL